VPGDFKGIEKNLKVRIFCHNNMKLFHAIAEDLLYLVHKKWSTYVDLESDTTGRNSEAGITTFISH
jgi:hypothetical protein